MTEQALIEEHLGIFSFNCCELIEKHLRILHLVDVQQSEAKRVQNLLDWILKWSIHIFGSNKKMVERMTRKHVIRQLKVVSFLKKNLTQKRTKVSWISSGCSILHDIQIPKEILMKCSCSLRNQTWWKEMTAMNLLAVNWFATVTISNSEVVQGVSLRSFFLNVRVVMIIKETKVK